MLNLEVAPGTDIGYIVMRVQVTFKDGVRLVADRMHTMNTNNEIVTFVKFEVNKSDFADLRTMEKTYNGCIVRRQEDWLVDERWVEILISYTHIKQVEFIN